MDRPVSLLLAALLFAAPASTFADDPPTPQWAHRGLSGTEIHAVRYLLGDLYVGDENGLDILELDLLTWRELDRTGAAGWPVTAIGRAPFMPTDRILTGRVDDQGQGALAVTYLATGATALSLEDQPGPFTMIDDTGYFSDYRMWACVPGGPGDGAVYELSTGSPTWTPISGHGLIQPRAFTSAVVSIGGDIATQTFLAGIGGVKATVDLGATWFPYGTGLPATTIRDVFDGTPCVATPTKRDISCNWLFAASDQGLYFTTLEAAQWVRVLDTPCKKVRFLPGNQVGLALVLTVDGRLLCALVTAEFIWDWRNWSSGLGPVVITDFDADNRRIAVGTVSHGLFESRLPSLVSEVPEVPAPLALAAAPNPFNPGTTLSFFAPREGRARLDVYDLGGRHVATLLDARIAAGPLSVPWRPQGLAGGVYVARLELNGEGVSRPLALIR